MAQRQRVRTARARRKLERTRNEAEIGAALTRLARFATMAQLLEEGPGVVAVIETRQALRRTARLRREAMARWRKAMATGWARGLSRASGDMITLTAAHPYAA